MSNYNRGVYFERSIQAGLKRDGWFVTRSAGSHGLIDLIALKAGEVKLIQCKTDGVLSKAERSQLQELRRDTGCQVWLFWREGTRKVATEIKEGG